MTRTLALAAIAMLAGCGGGGGEAPASTVALPPAAPPAAAPAPAPAPQATFGFANVGVHDPSVIKVGDTWYVFGSHLSAAKSTDLMNWTRIADGANDANPLFDKVRTALAATFAWAQTDTLWAPDVVQLDDGKFYMYYNACKGDSPRSALGVAVADKVEGPYVDKGVFLKSGMWDLPSEDGRIYDARVHPNTVDPQTFFDKDRKLWMIYGSYSGGIFILELDKATGKPKPGQGYGKHLLGGNHARIEGAYVSYNPRTKFYYMFTSFGGLDANGAYNVRVARSTSPDGPYVDAVGTDMATVKANPALPLFDDASIAPHGQKLLGNHQFALAAGETGTAPGYVSPGHNSVGYEAATDQYFMFFHSRFPGRGEAHEVRVHELFFNEDGWPVMAPLRYVPLSKSTVPLSAAVTAAEVAGAYKMLDHGKDISATIKQSQAIRLEPNGAVSGAATGSWTHKGGNMISLTLDGAGTFGGVLSRQWNPNAGSFAVTFSAQSRAGVSLWGVRTGQ